MAKKIVRATETKSSGHVIGRKDFAKISAVEQIRLGPELEQEFRAFETKGLPASERRRRLRRKYGRTG